MRAQKADQGGITTESFGTEVTTGPEQEEMPIHAHLSQSNHYLIVLLGHKLMRLPFMSTIELVDPELRDALALGPQLPLTAESLMRRRASALELIGTVPKPNLPDIATDEIHVESAFGAKPIRVLTYRPITSSDPLPVIIHIHGGGFVMGAPEMKDVENRLFASELRCAIYSVDHRLAPESPHPAPVEDIYSVFAWLHANAGKLGLTPARIGIKGESGGGGFAAAAALLRARPAGTKICLSASDLSDDRRPHGGPQRPTSLRKRVHLDAREQ